MRKKKILFSPLNWGLGHAVRSVPVLHELTSQGSDIILAGDGLSFEFLKQEFPSCKHIPLSSFKIKYSKSNSQVMAMILAFPKIVLSFIKDHRQLQHIIDSEKIDLVISDNRFGFFSKKCPCVYITHQLTIRMPSNLYYLEPFFRKIHQKLITRYTYCWIPDEKDFPNLSGSLSHCGQLPFNTEFIGILSRFTKKDTSFESPAFDYLFLLSGVEPQRSILEEKIISGWKAFIQETNFQGILVRGIEKHSVMLAPLPNLKIYNQLSGNELESVLNNSNVIVCRSGYTSIMELASLGKKTILVPTPGQPEQEYLGRYVASLPNFLHIKQENFSMKELTFYSNNLKEFTFISSKNLFKDMVNTILL
jgi:predicted glycosyltransferase